MTTNRLPHLRNLTPSQIVQLVTPMLPKQMQRWIARGDKVDVLGVFEPSGEPVVYLRLRPRWRRPVYLMLRQRGGKCRASRSALPPPWETADTSAGLTAAKRLSALERLLERIRRRRKTQP